MNPDGTPKVMYHGSAHDISEFGLARYAGESAYKAKGVLPKLETMRDAVKGIFAAPADAAGAKVIAKPIFDGTLADKVYTPEELKRDYRLTDKQAGLYQQFGGMLKAALAELVNLDQLIVR